MPLYEVKYHGEDGWKEISELKVIDELFKTFKTVTPVIQQMIDGKQMITREAVYRLKVKPKFFEVYVWDVHYADTLCIMSVIVPIR